MAQSANIFKLPSASAAEEVYRRFQETLDQQGEMLPEYQVKLGAATYTLNREQFFDAYQRLKSLDKLDGAADGYMSDFYSRVSGKFINGKWDGRGVVQFDYSRFDIHDSKTYLRNRRAISKLVDQNLLHFNNWNTPKKSHAAIYRPDDISLHNLAVLSSIFHTGESVIDTLLKEAAKLGMPVHFVISNEGIARGAYTYSKDDRRDLEGQEISNHILVFAVGGSEFSKFYEVGDPKESQQASRAFFKHELSHILFAQATLQMVGLHRYGQNLKPGDHFPLLIEHLSGNSVPLQNVNTYLRTADQSTSRRFGYFSEELCETVHIRTFAPQFYPKMRDYFEQDNMLYLDTLKKFGNDFYRERRVAQPVEDAMEMAYKVVFLKRLGASPSLVHEIDQKHQRIAAAFHPNHLAMYEHFKTWFELVADTANHPRLTEFMEQKVPGYFSDPVR